MPLAHSSFRSASSRVPSLPGRRSSLTMHQVLSLAEPPTRITGHQHLALAVIAQALHDVQSKDSSRACRRRAATFLIDHDALRTWCELAGVNPEAVRTAVLDELQKVPAQRF